MYNCPTWGCSEKIKGFLLKSPKIKEILFGETDMFNMKRYKEAQVTSTEKYLRRDDPIAPADDDQPIAEKMLPDRKGDVDKVTEGQMDSKSSHDMKNATGEQEKDAKLIEGILNEAKGSYGVEHRSRGTWLSAPPINAVVEKLRSERQKESKSLIEKDSNWTTDKVTQNGDLPKWPKNVGQSKHIALENDPRRFDQVKDPISTTTKNDLKPLAGDLTTADVDSVVAAIKNGQTQDYDAAIVAILKMADREKRELTDIEQKTVSDLKIARTFSVIKSG